MFPTLFEDCKTISISDLNRWGYLKPDQFRSGEMTWSRGERKTGSISFAVFTYPDAPYIELNYSCNQQPIKYQVKLKSIPSNLGKGVVWYFVCPKTNKQCRKLYLVNIYFYHRTAWRGFLYEKQTYSKKTRKLYKSFDALFGSEKAYEKINGKYFKSEYNGRPTKQYLKLLSKIEAASGISYKDLLRF